MPKLDMAELVEMVSDELDFYRGKEVDEDGCVRKGEPFDFHEIHLVIADHVFLKKNTFNLDSFNAVEEGEYDHLKSELTDCLFDGLLKTNFRLYTDSARHLNSWSTNSNSNTEEKYYIPFTRYGNGLKWKHLGFEGLELPRNEVLEVLFKHHPDDPARVVKIVDDLLEIKNRLGV